MEIKKHLIKGLCFFLCLFLNAISSASSLDDFPISKAKAEADVEIGGDSFERRFYKPRLRFEFPLKKSLLFLEMMYYQRINSRLRGEVDFWIRGGLKGSLSDDLIFEASLNHMSRHISSRHYSNVLDVNEIIGKLWIEEKNYRLGFGLGSYLGGSSAYNNLVVLNFELYRIFKSEFSFATEIKLVNFKDILHEIELSSALNESMDLFIRNTRHYEYKNTTYLGLRLKSDGEAERFIEHLRFGGGFYPFDDTHKAVATKEIKLEFFKKPLNRVLLSIKGIIPILKNEKLFLGEYRPESLSYPLSVEYEKKAGDELFLFGYCRYDVIMPLDVDLEFGSSLGTGIGFRNQPNFTMLHKKFRFEFFGGYNFKHSYDAGAAIGFNTVKRNINIGSEFCFSLNPDKLNAVFEVFSEMGGEVKIRPFLALEKIFYFNLKESSDSKILIGIRLIKWF